MWSYAATCACVPARNLATKSCHRKVLDPSTDVKKLREYATKDNVNFGENDMDVMANEWDKDELQDWGVEFAPEKPTDEFKERFGRDHRRERCLSSSHSQV